MTSRCTVPTLIARQLAHLYGRSIVRNDGNKGGDGTAGQVTTHAGLTLDEWSLLGLWAASAAVGDMVSVSLYR